MTSTGPAATWCSTERPRDKAYNEFGAYGSTHRVSSATTLVGQDAKNLQKSIRLRVQKLDIHFSVVIPGWSVRG